MPDALSPSQMHILFGVGEAEKKPIRTKLLREEPSTSLNLTLFTRQKTVNNWRFNIRSNFPNEWKWKIHFATTTIPDARWHGRTITALTHKNIPSKIEHKRQSVKIENPRSSWTMALSRSIITQAIHHQPPIKAKYNNYLVLRGRAPPRYVSSVHVRTVSELRSHK